MTPRHPALSQCVRLLRAEAGGENLVVEREELVIRAGVALPATTADEHFGSIRF